MHFQLFELVWSKEKLVNTRQEIEQRTNNIKNQEESSSDTRKERFEATTELWKLKDKEDQLEDRLEKYGISKRMLFIQLLIHFASYLHSTLACRFRVFVFQKMCFLIRLIFTYAWNLIKTPKSLFLVLFHFDMIIWKCKLSIFVKPN